MHSSLLQSTDPFSQGVLPAIGNTPLIKLSNLFKNWPFNVYAKLEMLNPGGSLKDRPALRVLKQEIENGNITSDTVIVESSSGNMGIGIAQICRALNIRFICVVDVKTTQQNIRILRALGAEIDLVEEPDPITGEFLQARLNRVQHLLKTIKSSYWPDQYSNLKNPESHKQTIQEISEELDGKLDFIFCATSTCGTLRGFSEYVRDHNLKTKVVAVDAVGSMIFSDKPADRKLPGMGAGIKPPHSKKATADYCIHVDDVECILGCRRMGLKEGVLIGGSSGGVVQSIAYARPIIPDGANCVVLVADRGERYLDTVFSETWVKKHFGDISHLLKKHEITGNTKERLTCLKTVS